MNQERTTFQVSQAQKTSIPGSAQNDSISTVESSTTPFTTVLSASTVASQLPTATLLPGPIDSATYTVDYEYFLATSVHPGPNVSAPPQIDDSEYFPATSVHPGPNVSAPPQIDGSEYFPATSVHPWPNVSAPRQIDDSEYFPASSVPPCLKVSVAIQTYDFEHFPDASVFPGPNVSAATQIDDSQYFPAAAAFPDPVNTHLPYQFSNDPWRLNYDYLPEKDFQQQTSQLPTSSPAFWSSENDPSSWKELSGYNAAFSTGDVLHTAFELQQQQAKSALAQADAPKIQPNSVPVTINKQPGISDNKRWPFRPQGAQSSFRFSGKKEKPTPENKYAPKQQQHTGHATHHQHEASKKLPPPAFPYKPKKFRPTCSNRILEDFFPSEFKDHVKQEHNNPKDSQDRVNTGSMQPAKAQVVCPDPVLERQSIQDVRPEGEGAGISEGSFWQRRFGSRHSTRTPKSRLTKDFKDNQHQDNSSTEGVPPEGEGAGISERSFLQKILRPRNLNGKLKSHSTKDFKGSQHHNPSIEDVLPAEGKGAGNSEDSFLQRILRPRNSNGKVKSHSTKDFKGSQNHDNPPTEDMYATCTSQVTVDTGSLQSQTVHPGMSENQSAQTAQPEGEGARSSSFWGSINLNDTDSDYTPPEIAEGKEVIVPGDEEYVNFVCDIPQVPQPRDFFTQKFFNKSMKFIHRRANSRPAIMCRGKRHRRIQSGIPEVLQADAPNVAATQRLPCAQRNKETNVNKGKNRPEQDSKNTTKYQEMPDPNDPTQFPPLLPPGDNKKGKQLNEKMVLQQQSSKNSNNREILNKNWEKKCIKSDLNPEAPVFKPRCMLVPPSDDNYHSGKDSLNYSMQFEQEVPPLEDELLEEGLPAHEETIKDINKLLEESSGHVSNPGEENVFTAPACDGACATSSSYESCLTSRFPKEAKYRYGTSTTWAFPTMENVGNDTINLITKGGAQVAPVDAQLDNLNFDLQREETDMLLRFPNLNIGSGQQSSRNSTQETLPDSQGCLNDKRIF